MKKGILIFVAALLVVLQPSLATQTINQSCVPQSMVDVGEIGKQKFSFIQNGTLEVGNLSWYKFKVESPSKFFITILPWPTYSSSYYDISEADFGLVVYDGNMSYIDSCHRVVMLNLDPGIYYARLEERSYPLYQETNYTIAISNNIEAEPNDGLTEANDIGTISGRVIFSGENYPAGDTDFFKFIVPGDGALEISCSEDASLVLYGYNDSKKLYEPIDLGESLIHTGVSMGTYILRAESYDREIAYGSYGLSISFLPMACDKVPNDNFTQAIPMGLLNASNESAILVETGCIKPGNDIDYYNFTVSQNMSVYIGADADGETSICLYDSKENATDCDSGYRGFTSNLTPGNYYVSVEGYESGINYELSVEREIID
jgi:hypothetical protein